MPKGKYPRKPRGETPPPAVPRNGQRPAMDPVTSLVRDTPPDDVDSDHEYELPVAVPVVATVEEGGLLYGRPHEIPLSEVMARQRVNSWAALYQDLLLRLEQTGPKSALEIPIRDGYVERAYGSLTRYFKENWGAGYVKLVTQKDPPRLYVYRGPNWRKPD